MIAVPGLLTLDDFLRLPAIEESPAWEYLDGEAVQKPMPGGKHSRLQAASGICHQCRHVSL